MEFNTLNTSKSENKQENSSSSSFTSSSTTLNTSNSLNPSSSSNPSSNPSSIPSSSTTSSSILNDKKKHKKENEILLSYNGQTIISASSQGNLPICVLLWGMASAKKINLMISDIHGNNPMHYACLANTAEVMAFFHQQLHGMLTPEIRLVDSINNAGETPLLRAMSTGQMSVIKVSLMSFLFFLSFIFSNSFLSL